MMETSVAPFKKAWVAKPARRLWPAVAGVVFGIEAGGLRGALHDAGDGAGVEAAGSGPPVGGF
jgi:hypothetical protein